MNKTKKVLSMVLALGMTVSVGAPALASCGKSSTLTKEKGVHTYNTYLSVSPSNWNMLTYKDQNDTEIMGYIGSDFYNFDFEYDANNEIVDGGFTVNYSAATSLVDVTADYANDDKWAIPDDATKGYAYKITLRNDLKWDDGTSIDADDFVYSMQEQLNPLFKNYRADSYYNGSTVIHNAKNYVYQGSSGYFSAATLNDYGPSLDSFEGLYFDATNIEAFNYIFGKTDMTKLSDYRSYFQVGGENGYNVYDDLVGYAGDARVPMTQEIADKLKGLFGADGLLGSYWGWADEEIGYFSVAQYTYPEMSFNDVGLFRGTTDQELIIVLDKQLSLLNDDGSLSYKAAYNMASLPLVHKDKYEANKHAPVAGSDVWTSTYNSSVATTASWGPYKLTKFQKGKSYTLERNEYWYGYNMPENEGYYQTDKIHVDIVTEWKSAWLKFMKGEIDGIGIDVSIADEYKNSDQAYFTPNDYVGSLQLQSSKEAMKNREEEGVNKTILSYADFRKALSLGLDRTDFTQKTTTASKAGYGLFGIMHYHDIEAGSKGVYRSTDYAKQTLCDTYGVDVSKYESLDAAVESITGYDLVQARALVDKAYDEAVAAGDIKATDKVVLTYGTSVDNTSTRRSFDYLNTAWKNLMVGTKLEGKFELAFDGTQGDKWADNFRDGAYEICAGGWSGAALDPGYMLMAYLSPDYMYSAGWDTSSHTLKATVHGVSADGKVTNNAEDAFEAEIALYDDEKGGWWQLLNDNWASGYLKEEFRVELIAQIEAEILKQYYTVPYSTYYSGSLQSFKTSYVTYDYNTLMGYGGIKYMKYNYDDAEWYKFAESKKFKLNYK